MIHGLVILTFPFHSRPDELPQVQVFVGKILVEFIVKEFIDGTRRPTHDAIGKDA